MKFHLRFLGTSASSLKGVDLVTIREGKRLSSAQAYYLVFSVTTTQIDNSFWNIGKIKI